MAFPLAGDGRVDSASEGGAESEHTGTRFARNNNTGPFAQHLNGEGSEERSNPFDLFAYDRFKGQLGHARSNSYGLGDWSCTDKVTDENLYFLGGVCEPPGSDVSIDTGSVYRVELRHKGFAVGS